MYPGIRRSSLLSLLVFIQVFSFAQSQPLKFITYTTNEGLQHNYTKKCIEDKKGFIWIVTEIGVCRFDGVNFKNFQHDETDPSSLPHNTVHDIAVDRDGRIWLALENGLCYYDPGEACFTSIDITETYSALPAALSICSDTINQAIWFITDKALFRLSTRDLSIETATCTNPSPTRINSMYVSSDNRLWIACHRRGFILYDISKDIATQFLPDNWVTHFYEDQTKTMWIGHWHSEQLIEWDLRNGKHLSWKEKDEAGNEHRLIVTGITRAPFFEDSVLLLSTLHMGIRKFDILRKEFIGGINRDIFLKYSMPTDYVNSIFTDSRNILWVCTWEGLCKVNIQEQQFRTMEIPFLRTTNFQYYNLVEGIVASDEPGIWWLGIDGCGVIKYDTARKDVILQLLSDMHKPNPFELKSWTDYLTKTDDGTIWVLNAAGFASIRNDRVTQYETQIPALRSYRRTVCLAPDQTFWITAGTHLIHFDNFTKKYTSYEIDSTQHRPYSEKLVSESGFCSDHHLYTGTDKGLYRFDINAHRFHRIPLAASGKDSLKINSINSLITDGQETIYLGTPVGLGIYNIRTGQYALKGYQSMVYPILSKSMLIDKAGHVWIYTPHALFKYDPLQDQFSKFTTYDGIYNFSSDYTHLFSFRQNIYIGYRGAYTEFDPLKVDANQTKVKPIITEVIVGNTVQKFDAENYSSQYFVLAHGHNDITFQYTGIDFTNSERINFSYKMDEEKEWHDAGTTRTVTFSNLDPGRHLFELQASNSSGIMSEQSATFRFYISPTLVQRWWFWPLIGIIFVTIVIVVAQKQVKQIREEERLKTETNKMMAELETKLLRSQMNPHFIFNSLNSIQKYIWENKEEDAAEYLAQFAKLIRAILENSRKEFISLQEELEVLKLYMNLEHRRSNGKFDYHIRISEELNPEELMLPPLLLQPYVENAIWHGVNKKTGHGNIDISIHQKARMLEIYIDDDGVGRPGNRASDNGSGIGKTSLGSDITQQRIAQLQATSIGAGVQILDKVEDGIPSGTTVILTVPVKYHAHA